MTSYEIVRRAVEFDTPERIPIRFGSMGIDDTFGVGIASAAGWTPREPCADEWGCVWHYPPQDSGIVNKVSQRVRGRFVCLGRQPDGIWYLETVTEPVHATLHRPRKHGWPGCG